MSTSGRTPNEQDIRARLVATFVTEEQLEAVGDYLFWLQTTALTCVPPEKFPDWHLTQFVIAYRTRGQLIAGRLGRELAAGGEAFE